MKYNCIIIDDHTLFNDGLSMILKESESFIVMDQIFDSRQAYHKCFSLSPDLVLVDYNMPNLNGLEVVKQLRSLPKIPKIVVLSMYAELKDIVLFESHGVNGYISKTIPANELINRLSQIMDGKNYFEKKQKEKVSKTDSFSQKNQLTKRELEILKLLKKEYTTEQMAQSLNLSYYTVETHRKNINQKLKFDSKKEYFEFLESL